VRFSRLIPYIPIFTRVSGKYALISGLCIGGQADGRSAQLSHLKRMCCNLLFSDVQGHLAVDEAPDNTACRCARRRRCYVSNCHPGSDQACQLGAIPCACAIGPDQRIMQRHSHRIAATSKKGIKHIDAELEWLPDKGCRAPITVSRTVNTRTARMTAQAQNRGSSKCS